MLLIKIDFSPAIHDENTTNGIKVVVDTASVTIGDLFTALQFCVAMRRTSSILDKMAIEIDQQNINIIPTNGNFDPVYQEEEIKYIPLERIPEIHRFFLDLRQDVHVGVQDHLNLEANRPQIKVKKNKISKPKEILPQQGIVTKRWKKKKK